MIPFTFSQAYERITLATRALVARVFRTLAPVSTDEDQRRREYILNIILAISLGLLSVLEATVIYNYLSFEHGTYEGLAPVEFGLLIFVCGALFIASKSGYARFSSYLLIGLYVVGTIYSGWTWGVSLPATLLATGLIILTSSVLIGSAFGFAMGGFMVIILAILGIHEKTVLGIPFWHSEKISTTDLVSYSAMFLFMSFIAWLSNREIDRSLERARASEKLLEIERDSLEQKVAERSKELALIESARMRELERSAEFGRMSQGIIHDLMSPLSSISLHIEQIAEDREQSRRCLDTIRTMMGVSRRMNSFMDNLSRYMRSIQTLRTNGLTDLAKETEIIGDIMGYKARMAGTKMRFVVPSSSIVRIDQTRIHQVLVNLISNAIEACEGYVKSPDMEHDIVIGITSNTDSNTVTILVSDTGPGISPDNMERMFKKPFTTKKRGTGSGLMTIAHIVEKELGGSITVTSKIGVGTTFTITLHNIIHGHSSQSDDSEKLPKAQIASE